jgi:hypothetical protein
MLRKFFIGLHVVKIPVQKQRSTMCVGGGYQKIIPGQAVGLLHPRRNLIAVSAGHIEHINGNQN